MSRKRKATAKGSTRSRTKKNRGGRPKKENPLGKQIAIRVDDELLKKLDAYVEQLREEHPGLLVSRASAIRRLMILGLNEPR